MSFVRRFDNHSARIGCAVDRKNGCHTRQQALEKRRRRRLIEKHVYSIFPCTPNGAGCEVIAILLRILYKTGAVRFRPCWNPGNAVTRG